MQKKTFSYRLGLTESLNKLQIKKINLRRLYIMLTRFSIEQKKEIKSQKQLKEQQKWAESGKSTAYEAGQLVTIGDADCDYLDYKHFVVAQIARMGFEAYEDLTSWDHDELVEDLAEEDSSNTVWKDDVMKYFDGMEGNC